MHLLLEGLSARVGGGITRLISLVDALSDVEPGNRYTVVLSPIYQSQIIDRLPPGVEVVRVPLRGNDLVGRSWFDNVLLPRLAHRLALDAVYFSGEGSYFHVTSPSIMLSGNLTLYLPPYSLETSRRKLALYRGLRLPLVRSAMNHVALTAFVSYAMMSAAIDVTGIAPAKAFVVYHGVEGAFSPRQGGPVSTEDGKYLLAVSSITRHKGYETLLTAYAALGKEAPPLLIAGGIVDTETHRRMCAIIQEEGLENRVRLLGSVSYQDLPELYRNALAFVLPSHLESFCLPLVEAMRSGLPIVVSNLPVCQEIAADSALYAAPGDAAGLAEQIRTVLRQPELSRALAAKAYQRSLAFTWNETAKTILAQFARILPS